MDQGIGQNVMPGSYRTTACQIGATGASATSESVGTTQTRKVSLTIGRMGRNKAYVPPACGSVMVHIRGSNIMRIKRVEELSIKGPGNSGQITNAA